jgi:carbon monoxide dehydrogenase subunit G
MQTLKSDTQIIQASASRVFEFLSDFNNLEKLMPEKVTNWNSTMTNCSFTIQGMATLNMKQGENKTDSLIQMIAHGKNPFQYDLNTHIEAVDENQCRVHIVFNADMNPMLAMMAKKPLGNFINILVNELTKQF